MAVEARRTSFLCFLACCAVVSSLSENGMRFGGWITYWDFDRGCTVVRTPRSPLEEVLLFAVHLDPSGTPIFARQEIDHRRAVRDLRERGYRVWMSVVNEIQEEGGGKAPQRSGAHPSDSAGSVAASAACFEDGFTGVDIDYENLHAEDRDSFTTFIRDLAIE